MASQPAELFQTVNPEESSLDADGFVGVDPIYQNAANDVDKPLKGSDGEGADEKAGESDEKSDEKADEKADDSKAPEAPAVPKTAAKK